LEVLKGGSNIQNQDAASLCPRTLCSACLHVKWVDRQVNTVWSSIESGATVKVFCMLWRNRVGSEEWGVQIMSEQNADLR
jgi:hypothetical protein